MDMDQAKIEMARQAEDLNSRVQRGDVSYDEARASIDEIARNWGSDTFERRALVEEGMARLMAAPAEVDEDEDEQNQLADDARRAEEADVAGSMRDS